MQNNDKEAVLNSDKREEFKLDDGNLEVLFLKECMVEVTVKCNTKVVERLKNLAYKKISKQISIPGFRKGYVPLSIIEKRFPTDLKKELIDQLVKHYFLKMDKAPRLTPLVNGDVSYRCNHLEDNKCELFFLFETEPHIPKIEISALSVNKDKEVVITESQVEEAKRNLVMHFASWNQIQDRPVQENDFVTLDIEDLDSTPTIQAFSNARFEVSDAQMAQWMKKLVLGKNMFDYVEGVSKTDIDVSTEVKAAFKPKKVRIYIKCIETVTLPPVDNDFAKKVGAKNVDDMTNKLTDILKKEKQESEKQKQRDSIGRQLLKNLAFDLPKSVVEKEKKQRINSILRNTTFYERWNNMSREEKAEKEKEIERESRNALSLFYISNNIVKTNKIVIKEDIKTKIDQDLMNLIAVDKNYLDYENESKERKAMLFSKMLVDKAQDFLIDRINGKD